SDSQSLSRASVVKVLAPSSRTALPPSQRAHETCSVEEPANDTRVHAEIARRAVKRPSERPATGHGPGQSQLVRVLKVPSDGQAVGRPRDPSPQRRKGPLEIHGRGLPPADRP